MQVVDLFNSPTPPIRLLTTLSAVRVRPGEPKIKHLHRLSESRSPIVPINPHSAQRFDVAWRALVDPARDLRIGVSQ